MSWKVHETDDVFAALRGLCSNSYRMYDPCEHRSYYDHECDAYECAVEDAAREYERLLKHCEKQREELAAIKNPLGRLKEAFMGSITDELREYAAGWRDRSCYKHLLAIADRIDAEHAKAVERAYGEGVMSVPIALDESQWVKLPVDADGVPIRVVDVMKGEKIGGGFSEPFEVVGYIMSNGELEPMDEHKCPRKHVYLHHHKPDSWESIIKDAVKLGYADYPTTSYEAELVERCMRLAGDAE